MLHDMFDLLGLPVLHTGLSLYQRWSTQEPPALAVTALNDDEEVAERSARALLRAWRKNSYQSDSSSVSEPPAWRAPANSGIGNRNARVSSRLPMLRSTGAPST